MIEPPTTRTGLAAMAAGAAGSPEGHLVLADWLEEHLDRPDLAAVFRLTQDDPRDEDERGRTRFSDFRYALLDGEVMLCMAAWTVQCPADSYAPRPQGHLLGLCVTPEATGQLVRWVRWLPHAGTPDEAVLAVLARMGEAVPKAQFEVRQ